jgi:tetratricopeptide (TPR) repeat protein
VGRAAAAADSTADIAWFFDDSLGIPHAMLGELGTAEMHFQAALAGARESGVTDAVLSAMNNLATLFGQTDRVEAAIEALRDVVRISEEHGLTWRLPAARNSLSANVLLLGRHAECAETATAALAEAVEQGDLRSAAYAHTHLADATTALGRDDDTLTHLREACRLARACGARALEAETLLSLGDTLARLDRTAEARRHWREALDHFDMLGLPEAATARARLTGGSAPR